MSDKFVTVMTFHQSFEAQLAKNLLENEGIESMLAGEFISDALFGNPALGDQVVLQVREDDAQRAAGILAAAVGELDENWEEQAESGAGVWTCSICGEPISNRLSVCHSCLTPREGIRADAPRQRTAIQPDLATRPTGEEVQKRDDIVKTPAPAPAPISSPAPMAHEEDKADEPSPAALGDDLARRAFVSSVFGVALPILLPAAWFFLLRVVFFEGEMSPKGRRYLFGALLLNALAVPEVLLLISPFI